MATKTIGESNSAENTSINGNVPDEGQSAAGLQVNMQMGGVLPVPNSKTAPPLTSEAKDLESSEEPEDLVDIPVLSEDGSRYEIQRVTRERATVITAAMMKEPSEGGGGDRLRTDAYNQAFHYAWISKERVHPSTTEALQKGYRPHVEKSGAESLGHTVETVPGFGQCVTYGDLVLVACPRVAAEFREDQYRAKRAQDRGYMQDAAMDHMENVLNEAGINDAKSGVQRARSGTDFNTQVLQADQQRAHAMADAYEQARNYDDGRKAYAGFQGKPGFNDAVPESPMVRRLMERQAALSGK